MTKVVWEAKFSPTHGFLSGVVEVKRGSSDAVIQRAIAWAILEMLPFRYSTNGQR